MNTPLFQLVLKAQGATKEDRIALLPLANKLLAYSLHAQREGLLAIENRLTDEQDPFLRRLLRFVMDGFDSVYIEDAIILHCAHCAGNAADLLRLMVIRIGVLYFHGVKSAQAVHGHLDILLGGNLLGPYAEPPRKADPFVYYKIE